LPKSSLDEGSFHVPRSTLFQKTTYPPSTSHTSTLNNLQDYMKQKPTESSTRMADTSFTEMTSPGPKRLETLKPFSKTSAMHPNTMTDDEESSDSEMKKVRKKPFLGSPRRSSSSSHQRKSLNVYGVGNTAMNVQPVAKTTQKELKGELNDRIRVCVRKRPLNKKEILKKETDVAIVQGRRTIHFMSPSQFIFTFIFFYNIRQGNIKKGSSLS
jgi:hypothetical protein